MSVGTPQTIWRDTDGLTEYSNGGINDIVDNLGNNLVDTLTNQIVDTGVVAALIPSTIWEEDDSR